MVQVAISADFLTAFAQIPHNQQKKVREFITRFMTNPRAHSINYEPIHDMRDARVRTVRIDLSYRAIVVHPEQGSVYLLAWVDNHDEAMAWARNKRFDINPRTGALQVIDVEEVQEAITAVQAERQDEDKPLAEYKLFETFADADLVRAGVPPLLLPAVRDLQTKGDLDKIESYLPAEAYEALWYVANLGYSVDQALNEVAATAVEAVDTDDFDTALTHPDSKRRFTVVQSMSELQEMLNAPLEKWRVFLHPSQARLVERHFNGPARVLGGAGTGKTVVAMHRARHLAANVFNQSTDRILFTTFTRNLANNIQANLQHLCGPEIERIEVVNLHRWAFNFLRGQGFDLDIAGDGEVNDCWDRAILAAGSDQFPPDFYPDEWELVVKAHGISQRSDYLRVSRRGRGVPLSRPQRAQVWAVFAEFERLMAQLGKVEWVDVFTQARLYLEQKGNILPYRAIVVDEAQDLFPEELRLIRQMVPEGENDIFLVGDAHQRIYGQPVVLSHCGINIRGRSRRLRINYRTTEEIRQWAVGVLAGQPIDDLDGGQDSHEGYKSLLHGLAPTVEQFETMAEEVDYLVTAVQSLLLDGVDPASICVSARKTRQVTAYQEALQAAGIETCLLASRSGADNDGPGVRLATMHRIKGLEFAHVLVAGANADDLPPFPVETADSFDLLQERCLLHVAATRARDTLTITGNGRLSPFLREDG